AAVHARAKGAGGRSGRAASPGRSQRPGARANGKAAVTTGAGGGQGANPEADLVRVTTVVPVDPATAFALFTEEVDAWWRRGPRYRFGDGTMRFEPPPRGRLVEVYDEAAGDLHVVGEVSAWEPGRRLAFAWRG